MGSIDIIKPLFTFLSRAINNFSNIKRKILGDVENWARRCWVRIKYAAPSDVPNSLNQQWPKNLQGLTQESGSAHRQRPTSSPRSSRTSGRSWTSWTGSSSSWWTRTDTSSRTRRWQAASFFGGAAPFFRSSQFWKPFFWPSDHKGKVGWPWGLKLFD